AKGEELLEHLDLQARRPCSIEQAVLEVGPDFRRANAAQTVEHRASKEPGHRRYTVEVAPDLIGSQPRRPRHTRLEHGLLATQHDRDIRTRLQVRDLPARLPGSPHV